MLMALLLPDPCDEHCPTDFKKKARQLLLKTRGQIDADDLGLRQALLTFIGDFANWDLSSDRTYLEVARGLVKSAAPHVAWQRVQNDVRDGVLGADYEKADLREIEVKVKDAEEQAKDEVWGGYRFVVLADSDEGGGLKVIDLGAGHSSGSESMCGRIIAALKAEAMLNESVGAGYIDRNWPPAFKESGAWPLASLRQSFLNRALTRLLDPDRVLKAKIVEFVDRGDFGLASGPRSDGTYERVWYCELCPADEVAFEPGVLLLKKEKAEALKAPPAPSLEEGLSPEPGPTTPEPEPPPELPPGPRPEGAPTPTSTPISVSGEVPPELWN